MTSACDECVRRCLLLAELGALLDYASRRRERLVEVLALDDAALIDALGGRRRAELHAWHERAEVPRTAGPPRGFVLCRHDRRFPQALRVDGAPAPLLSALGGSALLAELLGRPAVAIVDCARASDYGVAIAASLGRELTAAGLTVVAGVAGPIARAAHEGATTVGGSLAVLGNGLAVIGGGGPARAASGVLQSGCLISELPWEYSGGRWGPIAAERIAVALGAATIVVESAAGGRDLWAARHARDLGRPVGAVPGLVTNALAAGPHVLLEEGARLITNAAAILEMLHDAGVAQRLRAAPMRGPELRPQLRTLLELVGSGADTSERISAAAPSLAAEDAWAIPAALGELESLGLISRSAQGRYVRRDPPA
jgi:predicted Rossmann fold nucleotide-binding protein DprA/Smf involved in DNA uptake